ncbi:MAG: ferredoxin [Gordonia sp.]|uniref:Ferredoxin n=1 Tax=Gordonia rubripertincta TaxID=36822 RepID=A0ABT4MPA5_GORRU|nr:MULTISPECIES: ferredoxin [Mycobacteriales]MBA4024849.1 ferredoxin [Gordonia sp. (in: high G+C Gram-positive bacteria)]MCZ4548515.1 ferredoxin [Gordonia rubripertincta]OZG29219.1 ferredoxin [Williamsia sp. 1138]
MPADDGAFTLEVDRTACAGHGMCYGTRPELIDCDDEGYPVIPDPNIGPDTIDPARDAVAVCPERALELVPRSTATPLHRQ